MPILGVIASSISGNLWPANSYYQIATTTVGAGGASSVTFSGIPSTYTHLQIRGIGRSSLAGTTQDTIYIRINSDTGSNYSSHALGGEGSTAYIAQASASQNQGYQTNLPRAGQIANAFGAFIYDILDYTNTNKNKVIRNLGGNDNNGVGGTMIFGSTAYYSTSAITSITLRSDSASFVQYSQFDLYGIKVS